MLRQFLRDSAVYGIAGIVWRAVPVFLLPLYARVFTTAEYGVVELLAILMTFVNLVITLEVSQGVGRHFADADAPDKAAYFSTALWFTVGVFTVFLVVAFAAPTALAELVLGSSAYEGLIRPAAFAAWCYGVSYLTQHQLRWELKPRQYAASTLANTLVAVATTVVFIVVYDLGVEGVLYGQAIGALVGSALAVLFARRSYAMLFDARKLAEMIAYSGPLVVSGVGVFVAYYVDRFAIRTLLDVEDVGIYSAAYRVASIIGLVIVAAQSAITPLVFAHYRRPDMPGELAKIFRYVVFLALGLFLALSLFATEVIKLVAGSKYVSAAELVPLLVPAMLLWNLNVFAPGLFIAKKTSAIGAINVLAGLLNTVLCVTLISYFGLRGAAVAALVSAGISFGAVMAWSQRLYPAPYAWRRLSFGLAVAVAALAAGELVTSDADLAGGSVGAAVAKASILLVALVGTALILIGRRDFGELAKRAKVAW